jgi:hypothetical protein
MYSGSDLGKVPVTGHYSNKKSVFLQNLAFLMFAAVLLPRKVLMKDIKYTILSLSTFVLPFYFGSGSGIIIPEPLRQKVADPQHCIS